MKIQTPKTPLKNFEAAREILASNGYKIFTPNGRFFHHKHQFIAAKAYLGKRLLLIQLRRGRTLATSSLPPRYEDPSIIAKIEQELGVSFHIDRPLFRLTTEDDPWDAARFYISPKERGEFDLFVK